MSTMARLPIGTRLDGTNAPAMVPLRDTLGEVRVVIVGDDTDRYHVAVEGTSAVVLPLDDRDPLACGWTIVPSPDALPAGDGWRRGARVVRNGRRATITHFRTAPGTGDVVSWVVVADEAVDTEDEEVGVSFSSGEDGHPQDAGWALDVIL